MKNVATSGSDAYSYQHMSGPSWKSCHDLETFHGSYKNITDAVDPDHCSLSTVTSNAVHNGIVSPVENVVHHQLPSVSFFTNSSSLSSMSGGGVVYDSFPLQATTLTPSPACSHSQILGSYNEITATAAGVSEPEEKANFSSSSHTMVIDHGHLPVPAPTGIQAGAKISAGASSKAFDVYEFRDEDDSAFKDVGVRFRDRKLSESVTSTNSVRSQPSNHMSLQSGYQQTRICGNEADGGIISAAQNVAMIFDMDSKSIHRISLPVKTEPVSFTSSAAGCMPSEQIDSTSPNVNQSSSCMTIGERKLSPNGVNCKRLRLNNDANSYLDFETAKTNNHLPNIHNLISDTRKMNKCDGSMMPFDRLPQESFPSQPAKFMAQSLSSAVGNVTHSEHGTSGPVSIKLVGLSAQSRSVNSICNEVVKCEYDTYSSVPVCQFSASPQSARSPNTWLLNRNAVITTNNTYVIRAKPLSVSGQSLYPTYTDSEYNRYGIRQPNSMSTSQQADSHWADKNSYERSVDWRHMATFNHSSGVQSGSVGQNTFRNIPVEVLKASSEDLQHSSSSSVLDLRCNNSRMSPSTSYITRSQSFYPNLPHADTANRYNTSQVWQTIADSSSPRMKFSHLLYHHQHQQQHQQMAVDVKKESLEEMKIEMTDEEKLMNRLKCNLIEEAPHCQCQGLLCAVNDLSLSLSSLSVLLVVV